MGDAVDQTTETIILDLMETAIAIAAGIKKARGGSVFLKSSTGKCMEKEK